MPNAHAVVLAGGKGQRMNSETPKQFIKIKGLPIILHTVAKFLRIPCIETIVVVTPNDPLHKATVKQMFQPLLQVTEKKVIITAGGSTRHRSIFAGLKTLHERLHRSKLCKDSIVVIHDGVRPFVSHTEIIRVIEAAENHKAAGIMKQIMGSSMEIDTQYQLIKTLDREFHVMGEAPQAFHVSLILDCYENSSQEVLDNTTDCMQLLTSKCIYPKLIEGDSYNIKITTAADLSAARAVMLGAESIVCGSPSCDISSLSAYLDVSIYDMKDSSFLSKYLVSVVLFVAEDITEGRTLYDHFNYIFTSLKSQFILRFPYLATIIILMKCNDDGKCCVDKFRDMHNASQYDVSLHLILISNLLSSIDRLRRTLPLLVDDEALPSGQALRF